MTRLLMVGQTLQVPIQFQVGRLQRWLDGLLLAEAAPPEEKKGGLPKWLIAVIVVVALLCLGTICIVVVLALLGPTVGNVFSEINTELE